MKQQNRRPFGHLTEDEMVCFAHAMEAWQASRKRPDLQEEDRVKGALDAYIRQALVLTLFPSPSAIEAAAKLNEIIDAQWAMLIPDPSDGPDRVLIGRDELAAAMTVAWLNRRGAEV